MYDLRVTSNTVAAYLGPDHGRRYPRTWQDVVDAAAGGLIDESAWVDLKRELATAGGRAHHNVEVAKDLAAMAVDGGMLAIGVTDDHSRAGEVVGVELDGLADRITAIAGRAVSPPVTVRCIPVPDPATPGRGCLLVLVAPSPLAPHMVDKSYWGRTDKGTNDSRTRSSGESLPPTPGVRTTSAPNCARSLIATRSLPSPARPAICTWCYDRRPAATRFWCRS